MAQGLLITTADVKKFTALNGNIDEDQFIQFIKIAQDTRMQNWLGTDLLNKIDADIVASTLTGVYATLVSNYIKDCLIHWALVEYLPFAAYSISNKGVYKHQSENSVTVEKNELDYLIEKERDTAEFYTQRLVDYLCNNSESFPEYTSNTNEDMHPDQNTNFTGWYL